MTGLKDFINLIFPVYPTDIAGDGDFPYCPKMFKDLSESSRKDLLLGRLFCRLCRLTGVVWLFWCLNLIVFISDGFILLYHWGFGVDMDQEIYWGKLSCKMIIAMLTALLVLSKLILGGLCMWTVQLANRCLEYI